MGIISWLMETVFGAERAIDKKADDEFYKKVEEVVDRVSQSNNQPQTEKVIDVEDPSDVINLSQMTRKELIAFADERDIKIDRRTKKATILQAIIDGI